MAQIEAIFEYMYHGHDLFIAFFWVWYTLNYFKEYEYGNKIRKQNYFVIHIWFILCAILVNLKHINSKEIKQKLHQR